MDVKYNLRKRNLEIKLIKDEKVLRVNLKRIKVEKKFDVKEEIIDTTSEAPGNSDLESNKQKMLIDNPNSKIFCPICKAYYSAEYYRRRHVLRHSLTNMCHLCNEMLTESGKNEHICIKSNSRLGAGTIFHDETLTNYSSKKACDICASLIDKSRFEIHRLSHNKLRCKFCGKVSSCKSNFERHHRTHTKKEAYPCKECDESFEYLVQLARHSSVVHRHHDAAVTQCPLCNKIVTAIKAHLRTHQHNARDCEQCGVTLNNHSAHVSHLRYHRRLAMTNCERPILPRAPGQPQCSICGIKFEKRRQLVAHTKKTHIRMDLFPCPYCEENESECVSLMELVRHISQIHGHIEPPFTRCPYCSHVVPDIETHIVTQHSIALLQCELCADSSFTNEATYHKHCAAKHNRGTKTTHFMDIFMAKYSRPSVNVKKVHCFICRERVRVSHMRRHLSAHSTFKCRQCHKIIVSLDSLDIHRANHNRPSTYCPLCKQCFVSHIRLMAHMISTHKTPCSVSRRCSRC